MESIADAVVQKVNAKLAKLKVGPPEDDSDITPVVTESSANFIEGLVMDAKEKGATFCQEYRREGNLIWPLLLDHVRPDMRIAWEEPFGPVLPVIRINSVEEGIHHCNASNFGLQVFPSPSLPLNSNRYHYTQLLQLTVCANNTHFRDAFLQETSTRQS
jgi:glyceraldehyde-3-phosphate dehydrogenase (NADP+)